jgi:Cu/Ag efflux protein CusF
MRNVCRDGAAYLPVLVLLVVAGCSAKPAVRSYKLEGKVVAVDKVRHSVMIDMKAIPDYMEAMTMAYDVPDKNALGALNPGDHIDATLRVSDEKSWLENVRATPPAPATK